MVEGVTIPGGGIGGLGVTDNSLPEWGVTLLPGEGFDMREGELLPAMSVTAGYLGVVKSKSGAKMFSGLDVTLTCRMGLRDSTGVVNLLPKVFCLSASSMCCRSIE